MKVWIITGGYYYEDSYVLGVAKTKKKANEIAKREENDDLDWISVDEWEVEE